MIEEIENTVLGEAVEERTPIRSSDFGCITEDIEIEEIGE